MLTKRDIWFGSADGEVGGAAEQLWSVPIALIVEVMRRTSAGLMVNVNPVMPLILSYLVASKVDRRRIQLFGSLMWDRKRRDDSSEFNKSYHCQSTISLPKLVMIRRTSV